MKVKVYQDQRKEYRTAIDNVTLLFPVPKRLQEREGCKHYAVYSGFNSDGSLSRYASDYVPAGTRCVFRSPFLSLPTRNSAYLFARNENYH